MTIEELALQGKKKKKQCTNSMAASMTARIWMYAKK